MTAGGAPTPITLALQLGRTTAADLHTSKVVHDVCRALPQATGAAGAVILLITPTDIVMYPSDENAGWLGELQRRSGAGPLHYALRSGRNMVTPDLTRVGPPDLAAAAAEIGVFTSLSIPLLDEGHRLGGVQLLGNSDRPVGEEQTTLLRHVVEALRARLIDAKALWELAQPRLPMPVPRTEHEQSGESTSAIATVAPADLPSPRTGEHAGRHQWEETTEPEDVAAIEDIAAAEPSTDAPPALGVGWFSPSGHFDMKK